MRAPVQATCITTIVAFVASAVVPAMAAHHQKPRQQLSLECPRLVDHDFLSRWNEPIPFTPFYYTDNGVKKCMTQELYDRRRPCRC